MRKILIVVNDLLPLIDTSFKRNVTFFHRSRSIGRVIFASLFWFLVFCPCRVLVLVVLGVDLVCVLSEVKGLSYCCPPCAGGPGVERSKLGVLIC